MSLGVTSGALRVPAALTAFALAGWIVTAVTMQGMTAMDGPGAMGSYLWLWTAMCAGMMLPALVPAATLAARVGRSSTGFVAGYLAVWVATGVAAFEVARELAGSASWIAAAAIGAAALYQLTPLKDACLRRCRGPLGLLVRRRAFHAGVEHGLLCLGCCWALMLAVVALGAASLLWMAAVAIAIFLEKATSLGARASVPIALALGGAAVWVAL